MSDKVESDPKNQIGALKQIIRLGRSAAGIRVAVLDSSIDCSSPGINRANIDAACDLPGESHGTAVATILSHPEDGIAPQATLFPIQIFSGSGSEKKTLCSEYKLEKAIREAIANNCHIVNISGSSLSRNGHGSDGLRKVVDLCMEKKIIIVASVGNDGQNIESVPASMNGVIAVGAIDKSGSPAAFNNKGRILRYKAFYMPGVNLEIDFPDGQRLFSGSSFATPIISGIAANIKNIFPEMDSTEFSILLRKSSFEGGSAGSSIPDFCKLLENIQILGNKNPTPVPELQKGQSEMEQESNSPAGIGPAEAGSALQSSAIPSAPDAPTPPPSGPNSFVHGPGPVKPAEAGCHCKSLSPAGSGERVFVVGKLGYDFRTETNRDYFQQAMNSSPVDGTPTPFSELYMGRFLAYKDANGGQPHLDTCTALTWILKIDDIPIYAIRPQSQFALMEFGRLIGFLLKQLGLCIDECQKAKEADLLKKTADDSHVDKIDRISIAGEIVDEVRLYNGQVVPVISPILRGMFGWNVKTLYDLNFGGNSKDSADKVDPEKEQEQFESFRNFLNRVYYELRNRGVEGGHRAMNYAATNAYQAAEVYKDALKLGMFLDKISVEPSPLCRPDSECWDVVMEFFNPQLRDKLARKVYRYTVDVGDVMPVTFGPLRSWYVY